MTDYKEMYLSLMRETEKALNILIAAQKKCEEMCVNDERDGREKLTVLKK